MSSEFTIWKTHLYTQTSIRKSSIVLKGQFVYLLKGQWYQAANLFQLLPEIYKGYIRCHEGHFITSTITFTNTNFCISLNNEVEIVISLPVNSAGALERVKKCKKWARFQILKRGCDPCQKQEVTNLELFRRWAIAFTFCL